MTAQHAHGDIDAPADHTPAAHAPADDGPAAGPEAELAAALRRHREEAGLSVGELAALVCYTREHVSRAERPGRGLASRPLVAAIDAALSADGALVAVRAHAERQRRARRPAVEPPPPPRRARHSGPADTPVEDLAATVLRFDTGDDVVADIDQAVATLAACHTLALPRLLLAQAVAVHDRIQTLLAGQLRLRQRREVYRILSDLLAHACLLLGDLGEPDTAERWGRIGLAYAREAGCREALPRTALATTLRWQARYIESADMARGGLTTGPPTPVQVQLAAQEANAAALLGDAARARTALDRAHRAAAHTPTDTSTAATGDSEDGVSVWAFPPARLALFAQSVARHTGDPDAALAATDRADALWAAGAPRVAATWAQVRLGAAIAHAERGALDAAVHEADPVFDTLPPHRRLATVTGYVEDLVHALTRPPVATAAPAVELTARCRVFTADAVAARR